MAASLNFRQAALTCSGHTRPVVYLSFSPLTKYGYYLISACKDGMPMLRQGDTGDWIGTFEGHKGAVLGVALNNDASKSATGAADFMAKLWNALTGDEIHSFTHHHIVRSVEFNNAGDKLLTGSNERLLKIFDLVNYSAEPQVFKGHQSYVKQALFLNDNVLISSSEDKSVRFWDRRNQDALKELNFEKPPSSIELSADHTTLVVSHDHFVSFWNTNTFDKMEEFSIPTQVNSASLHPAKTVFVCAGEDCKVYKYDFKTGQEQDCFKGHFGTIHCIKFSPDGELYATGSEDGTLRLWQTTVGKNYGLWKTGSGDKNSSESIQAT